VRWSGPFDAGAKLVNDTTIAATMAAVRHTPP